MTNKNTEPTLLHFSIGSAANGTHLSTDVLLDDDAPDKLQQVMDLWAKTTIYRKANIDARMKHGI